MKETIVHFGEEERLSGIVTAPPELSSETPVIIFLNAGIVHRIGPNRLHVKLARNLASEGYPCLRFDLSGLGESPAAPPGCGYEEQSIIDTVASIDFAEQQFGSRPIVLAGICSGADNSYRTALRDDRVKAMILLDPYAYQNSMAKVSDLAQRAQDPERWKRLVGRLAGGGRDEPDEAQLQEEFEADDNDRIAPPREEFGTDLQSLTARGVDMLLLYSSSVRHLINHKNQFQATFKDFDFNNRLEVDVLSHVDHTYTEISAQKELLRKIRAWVTDLTLN